MPISIIFSGKICGFRVDPELDWHTPKMKPGTLDWTLISDIIFDSYEF